MYRIAIIAFVLLAGPFGVAANDGDAPIVIRITGSHLPEPRRPQTRLFHLDREQIEARQASSTTELLRGAPGVNVTQSGGEGGLTFVSIRGGEPNFTAFVVDGVLMNDPTNTRGGSFDLSYIDPRSIEKIEVYAGGGSSIWGADALAGVVNITTRRGDGGSAYLGVGSDDAVEAGGSVGGRAAGTLRDWSVSANFRDSGDAVEGDKLRRSQFSGSASFRPYKGVSSTMGLFLSEGDAEAYPEDSGGPRLATIREPEKRWFQRTAANLGGQLDLAPDVILKGSAAWTRNREDIENPGIAPGVLSGIPAIDTRRRYERTDLYGSLAFPAVAGSYAVVGMDFVNERGSSKDVIDFGFPLATDFSLDRSSLGVFVEATLSPAPRWELDATARVDFPDDLDSQSTYRAGVSYQVPDWESRIALRYSEGFKLPSFFALGSPLVGNPDLKPETSRTYELRLSQPLVHLGGSASFSVYRNDYRDLVDFDPVAFTNVNRSHVRTDGAEASLQLAAARDLDLSASVTYNRTRVIGEDVKLRRRPDWQGSLRGDWRIVNGVSLFSQLDYTGRFYDSSVPTGMVGMPDFVRIDAGASWALDRDLSVECRISNVLDDDYEEAVGFPNPGRGLSLRLNATF